MENVRITFEVPSTGRFTVKELTESAKRFVAELVDHDGEMHMAEPLKQTRPWALAPHTEEEISAELDRRWEHYLAHPETAVPNEQVMRYFRSLI